MTAGSGDEKGGVKSSGDHSQGMSSGRRWLIGTNVAVTVVVAAALLIAINWIGSLKHVRRDLATLGAYGLTDRTKSILNERHGDLSIWMLYQPDEEDEEQQERIARLQDYLDELQAFAPDVTVTHVSTLSQREKLVTQLSSVLGGEAEQHKETLAEFTGMLDEIKTELQTRSAQAQALIEQQAWLGDFPLFAEVVRILHSRGDALDKAREEIDELIPPDGIPKYADAATRAKTAVGDVKKDLSSIAEFLSKLKTLADEAARPDSMNIRMLREVAAGPVQLIASLRQTVGPENSSLPADRAAVLKAYSDRGVEVRKEIETLVRRVDTFARKFPSVTQHPNWSATVKIGPFQSRMEVATILQKAGASLGKSRLQILGTIDTGNAEELAQAIANVRQDVSILEQNAAAANELLSGLADRLTSLDAGSRTLLDEAGGGKLFSARITALTELEKKFEGLPELKLGSIADQLKEDNIVVVRANDKVRVVSLSEVFRIRESVAGGFGSKDEGLGRTFNGDGAISSAVLAVMRDRPFATVVLVSFEPPAPQQRSPFPPPRSRVPSAMLSEFRKHLEAANFKVVDWNLATTEEAPKPEEGTESVYVLLPPAAPAPPNPFDRNPQPQKTFGDKERKKIREVLANDGRALFVAAWEIQQSGPFGGGLVTPEYRYGPILESDWGIRVDNAVRVVWVIPETRAANSFSVAGPRFAYMPAGGFTEHPAGKPSRGTRFLVNDACPITFTEAEPEGVTREVVQRLQESENYIGARIEDLISIVNALRNPSSEGIVTLKAEPNHGPFDLMVAAERKEGDKNKGRIAVIGFGGSLVDGYLNQPVMREGAKIRFDPPPTESADLVVNTLYWLQGQTEWIARGPVPKPTVDAIPKPELETVQAFVWAVWPILVLVPGVIFWFVRRK